MDNLFNLVIILIPLAIFIGRAITSARKKFEASSAGGTSSSRENFDDSFPGSPIESESVPYLLTRGASDFLKEKTQTQNQQSAGTAARREAAAKKKRQTQTVSPSLESQSAASDSPPVSSVRRSTFPAGRTASSGNDFVFNLSHLSPLKQAVVMAEVLGKPKGMV